MTKLNTTPGEWVYNDETGVIVEKRLFTVARLHYTSLEQCKINGLLMASAPDLYSACEKLLHADSAGSMELLAEAVESAEKALKKARG